MGKSKTIIVLIIVIVVVILAACAHYLVKRTHTSQSSSSESANPQTQASTQKKSLFDFFSMAGSQKCTFSDSANKSTGIVYVSSGKMHGDFMEAADSSGKIDQTHMVNDGAYVYIWTDGQKSGYKISDTVIKQEGMQPTASAPQPSQGMDMHHQANYSCSSWTADSSLFVPPTDITFTDYSKMMPGTSAGTTTQGNAPVGGNAAACSECNQAPAGAARNQCLAALHC